VVHKDEQITPAKYNPYNPNAKQTAQKHDTRRSNPIQIIIQGDVYDNGMLGKIKNAVNEALDQREREEYHAVTCS
jgi:hypothetical protein